MQVEVGVVRKLKATPNRDLNTILMEFDGSSTILIENYIVIYEN